MELETAKEIIACLPKGRTLYYYFRGRYAVELLQWHLASTDNKSIAALRSGRYAQLLDKPVLRTVMSKWGNGQANPVDLNAIWTQDYETYLLSLGLWGSRKHARWYQLSRPGINLVLQLNFSRRHDRLLDRCGIDDPSVFNGWGHPVAHHRNTLAWARIDLDFNTGEALIEEIQNDWLREVDWLRSCARHALRNGEREFMFWGEDINVTWAIRYLEDEIERHRKIWSEAMLSAALHFLIEELGVETIYFHSYDTGAKIKRLGTTMPPRSLYTRLPRQFCFEEVCDAPQFLRQDKHCRRALKKIRNPKWFRMAA